MNRQMSSLNPMAQSMTPIVNDGLQSYTLIQRKVFPSPPAEKQTMRTIDNTSADYFAIAEKVCLPTLAESARRRPSLANATPMNTLLPPFQSTSHQDTRHR
jgi:hypothetical protein